jgi:hypothetical protein
LAFGRHLFGAQQYGVEAITVNCGGDVGFPDGGQRFAAADVAQRVQGRFGDCCVRVARPRSDRGDRLGIVGESGAGKSVTGCGILNLVSKPGYIAGGRLLTLPGRGTRLKGPAQAIELLAGLVALLWTQVESLLLLLRQASAVEDRGAALLACL